MDQNRFSHRLNFDQIMTTVETQYQELQKIAEASFHLFDQCIESPKKEALQTFLERGFPTSKDEEYKFTPFAKLVDKQLNFANSKSNIDDSPVQELKSRHSHSSFLVFLNGRFEPKLSTITDESIEVLRFNELSSKDLLSILQKEISKDPFYLINTASFSDGLFIKVKNSLIIDKNRPVVILNIFDPKSSDFSFQRTAILAEENSESTFVELRINSEKSPFFYNEVVQVVAEKSSRLNYYHYQNKSNEVFGVTNFFAHQHSQSLVNHYNFDFSGKQIRNNVNIHLDDQHSETHMYGVYMLEGDSHVDNHTTVDHRQPNCFSNELYRGILDGQSKGVFNGKIYVRPDAQKTNAFQANNNIILSDNASINTKPQLEIWADDVKCSHGCTSGQLDEDAIFYLRARGIDHQSAKAMLLRSFAGEVIENVKVDWLKELLYKEVDMRLLS